MTPMRRWLCVALALAPIFPAHAQRTPVVQDGTVQPSDLLRGITQGRYGAAAGLAGDINGRGVNPFSVTDNLALGTCWNSGLTGAAYWSLCLGHKATGDALIAVDSVDGAADKNLIFRVNGVEYPLGGIAPTASLLGGTGGALVPVTVPTSPILGWNGTVFTQPTPASQLRINANHIQFGKTEYPTSAYGFLDGPNTYLYGDAGNISSDVSMVARVTGSARWEWGMVGAITDSVNNQSFRVKSVTGDYPTETYVDRFVISDAANPRYPSIDVYPDTGQNSLLRVYGNIGLPCIVVGNSNCQASPTGTGAGLELNYDLGTSISRITSIEHDLFYRDLVIEGNNIRFSTGPVFLNFDMMRLNSQGAIIVAAPIQKATSAVVSNLGEAEIATMTGYVPGTDVLTALGGTGTAPTLTVTSTQASRVNSIAAAGSGGTPGSVVLTGTTGTGTKFQVNGTIGAGGTLTATGTFVTHGDYTVNPTSLTAEPVIGGGLAGAQINIGMGAATLTLASAGALTVTPNTPTATSSSGAGAGATLNITYQCGLGCINVASQVMDNGTAPTGTLGSGYVRADSPTLVSPTIVGTPTFAGNVTIDNGAGALALLQFADGGTPKFDLFKQTDNTLQIYDYAHAATAWYLGTAGALTIGETGVAGVSIGAPTFGDLGSGSLNVSGGVFKNGVEYGTLTAPAATAVVYSTGSALAGDATNFNWDATNRRLTITAALVSGTVLDRHAATFIGSDSNLGGAAHFHQTAAGGRVEVGYNDANNVGYINSRPVSGATQLALNGGGGQVLIGETRDPLFFGQPSGMLEVKNTLGPSTSIIKLYNSGGNFVGGFYQDASSNTTMDVSTGASNNNPPTIHLDSGGLSWFRAAFGVNIGTPTGGDKGAGTLNVSGGVYVNGVLNASTVSPSFTTPALGVATATSINGNVITTGTGTLTLGAGKTLTVNNSLTLTATDGSTLAIGAGGTLGSNAYTSTAHAPLASPQFSGEVTINDTAAAQLSNGGTYTTANGYMVRFRGTLASSVTGNQLGLSVENSFAPSGASLSAVFGISSQPNISGSALDFANYYGIRSILQTGAGYTGIITNGYGVKVDTPTISGANPFTNFFGFDVAAITNGDGITSGTVTNKGIRVNTFTAAAGAGGTVLNYAAQFNVPSGSSSGTANRGLYIAGNGGGLSTNHAIYNDSTAAVYLSNGDVGIGTAGRFGFGATGVLDVILSRVGAAHLRFGGADAAAPVAQTLSFQRVVGGTTNAAGANTTLIGSLATGNAASGSWIFQTGLVHGSDSTVQTPTTALTINGSQNTIFGGSAITKGSTVAGLPAAGNAGARRHVTDQLTTCAAPGAAITGGGAVTCPVFDNGAAWVGG